MSPESPGKRLLNPTVLESLGQMVGRQGLPALLEGLRLDCIAGMTELASALAGNHRDEAREIGHKFKGVFSQYGVSGSLECATRLAGDQNVDWRNDAMDLLRILDELMGEVCSLQQNVA